MLLIVIAFKFDSQIQPYFLLYHEKHAPPCDRIFLLSFLSTHLTYNETAPTVTMSQELL